MKENIKSIFGEEELNPAEEAKINMAYWLPVINQIGMRTPKTILVHTGDTELGVLTDGGTPKNYAAFLERLRLAVDQIGTPCFLKTGLLSNKHGWKRSCYLTDKKNLKSHIYSLVETSFIANISGLPLDYSIWAVRELIKTNPLFTAFHGDMPITKERRIFIKDGKLICNHPYWTGRAFKKGDATKEQMKELQSIMPTERKELKLMAEYVGRYFKDYWSVDFLQDVDKNWWLIDMATGQRSYHWDSCKTNIKK